MTQIQPSTASRPRDWRSLMLVSWGFGAGWALCWFGGCWLSGRAPERIDGSFEWERGIPFVAAALPIYLSLDLAMLLLPMPFRSGRDIAPLALTLLAQSVVAAVCFAIFPLRTGFTERPEGIWGEAFGFIGLPNLGENGYAPSLHVAFAVTIAACLGWRWGGWRRLGLPLWAAGVAVSTVLVHEHLVIDALTGAALGLATIPLLRRLEGRWPPETH